MPLGEELDALTLSVLVSKACFFLPESSSPLDTGEMNNEDEQIFLF